MRKLLVYVEGQTEERFVKSLLIPYLETREIYCQPIVATTKLVYSQPLFKGGAPKYHKAKKEICMLLGDTSAVAVTTMLDYYGLDVSFPGRGSPKGSNCYDRVRFVEEAIRNDLGSTKFTPFLTLHEFEGLLFSSPQAMAATLLGGQICRELLKQSGVSFKVLRRLMTKSPRLPIRELSTLTQTTRSRCTAH